MHMKQETLMSNIPAQCILDYFKIIPVVDECSIDPGLKIKALNGANPERDDINHRLYISLLLVFML